MAKIQIYEKTGEEFKFKLNLDGKFANMNITGNVLFKESQYYQYSYIHFIIDNNWQINFRFNEKGVIDLPKTYCTRNSIKGEKLFKFIKNKLIAELPQCRSINDVESLLKKRLTQIKLKKLLKF